MVVLKIESTVARQKSVPKRKKRVFRVCILLILLFITIFIIMFYTPLALISGNKIFKKEFNLFEKLIIFKVFCFRKKLIIIIQREKLKKNFIIIIIRCYFIRF